MTETLNSSTVGWIVVISVMVSIVASYAAFSFAERVANSTGRARALWLAAGAASLGLGIWSMHYLGMLAVRLPVAVEYHVPTVLLSLLCAVLASAVALEVVSRDSLGPRRHIGGSLLMGAGIGAMHYTGMHAMRCAAMHRYDLVIVGLSVIVAVLFSYAALKIAFVVRRNRAMSEWLRIGGAAVMGLGIAAMHYTAMSAVTFERSSAPVLLIHTVRVSTIGAVAVAFTMSLVLFGALISTILDRRVHQQMQALLDELSEERDRFHAVVESSMDALFMCNAFRGPGGEIEDFVFQYLNSNVEKMIFFRRDQLIGRKMCETIPVNRSLGLFDLYKQVVLTGIPLVHEFPIRDENVTSAWIRIQAVKVRDGVAITASDITQRKENEEQVLHLAHHDPLTGLLNRSLLHDRIQQAIEMAARHKIGMAAFLIDLDGFKAINDSLGHAAGDFVLVTVAQRLTALVRACDSVIRIGGDEFVVVITDLAHSSDADLCARKLVSAFDQPITMNGRPLHLTCSIGAAVFPDAAIEPRELLRLADLAMYGAKQRGKNRYQIAETEAVAS